MKKTYPHIKKEAKKRECKYLVDIEAVETYDLMSQGNFVCTVCGTMPSNLKDMHLYKVR